MTECACSVLVSGSGICLDSGTLFIPNGMVTYGSVSIGSEATYQCVDGFSLSGVGTRTCQGDGSWSGSQPTCLEEDEGNFVLKRVIMSLKSIRIPQGNVHVLCACTLLRVMSSSNPAWAFT